MSSSEQHRSVGPIRQLSLQQQPTRRQQQIRRQRSADNDKYPNPIRGKLNAESKHDDNKPKLRIAWGEIRPKTCSPDEGQVQIVARQIAGKSRPLAQKPAKKSGNLDKTSILYSHQELAERLRLAWKQREESKANLNIFLARNTCEERCESGLSNAAPRTPSTVDNRVADGNRTADKFRIYVPMFESCAATSGRDVKIRDASFEEVDDEGEGKGNGVLKEKNQNVETKHSNKNKLRSSENDVEPCESNNPPKVSPKANPMSEDPSLSAKLKRASFRSGSNKAFTGPIIERPPSSKDEEPVPKDEVNVEPKLRKTTSSASQRRLDFANSRANLRNDSTEKSGTSDKLDGSEKIVTSVCEDEPSRVVTCARPVKSASRKRRIKWSKRRGLSIGGSKDGTRKNRGKLTDSKANDVVTMVSLVSSADSDSDVDEHPDDKLIRELRSKLPTTPIIKSAVRPASTSLRRPVKSVSFHQSSFDNEWTYKDDITKEEKKVTSPSFATEGFCTIESNAMTWKSEVDLALPLLQLPQEPDSAEMPLTEREKRCLVVPIGNLTDKKRKLLRTRSAGPKLIEMPCPPINSQESYSSLRIVQNNVTSVQPITAQQDAMSVKVTESSVAASVKLEQRANTVSSEPYFQTTKEKECWHLYRRMCDKGVCVSFDTVLRGMLTPTEYRLRQKEISQTA